MNLRNLRIVFTSVTLGLLLLCSPAMAKESKSIHFTASAVGVLTSTDSDGDVGIFSLTGTATEMGAVTGTTVNRILDNKHQDGIFFFRDKKGDVLIFSYKVKTIGSQFVGHYTVEGGTGPFSDASGDGNLVVTPTAVAGTVTITIDGDLSHQ